MLPTGGSRQIGVVWGVFGGGGGGVQGLVVVVVVGVLWGLVPLVFVAVILIVTSVFAGRPLWVCSVGVGPVFAVIVVVPWVYVMVYPVMGLPPSLGAVQVVVMVQPDSVRVGASGWPGVFGGWG